jgi:hypothetical protein
MNMMQVRMVIIVLNCNGLAKVALMEAESSFV